MSESFPGWLELRIYVECASERPSPPSDITTEYKCLPTIYCDVSLHPTGPAGVRDKARQMGSGATDF